MTQPLVLPGRRGAVEEDRHLLASADTCRRAPMRQSGVHAAGRAFRRPCVVFLALIDPITLPKTASAGPYGKAIEMEIQLVLMDAPAIINLCVGSGGGRWGGWRSRQIAAHVDVHYANVRCSHEAGWGGVVYFPPA